MEKKYISLKDLYLKESFGKQVPPPPRLKVVGEQDDIEKAYSRVYNIFYQDSRSNEEPEAIGSVDRKDFTKIVNIARKDVSNDALDQLVEINNLSELSSQIKNIFSEYEIDYVELNNLLIKNKQNLHLKDVLKSSNQTINLKKLILPVILNILSGQDKTDQNAEELYYKIFNLQIVGGSKVVSVGNGEALLALFTDATKTRVERVKKGDKSEAKPIKGDITFANGTIEVKVHKKGAGRIASQRQGAFKETENQVKRILVKKKNKENISLEDLIPCYTKTNEMKIEVSQEDVNAILGHINKETDNNKIESLIIAPILSAYARKGFTYIMLISPEGVQSGDALCIEAQNFNVVLSSVLNNQDFMGVDGDGIDVSNIPVRKKGRATLEPSVSKAAKLTSGASKSEPQSLQPQAEPEKQSQTNPNGPILLPPNKNIPV